VQNPFRSEEEAFHFLIRVIFYFAAIIIAALIDKWAGVAVFVILTLGVLWWVFMRGEPSRPVQTAPRRLGADDERRILVIANETVGGETLRKTIAERAAGYREDVLVVCPALNSPLRHWASDEDGARAAAAQRLERSLERLHDVGIDARGQVGDGEPLQAMEDALRTFGADEIIISTHPEGRSHWLEKRIVEHARERFAVPITHVVVDLEAEREEVR
jgi:hypothetical protein